MAIKERNSEKKKLYIGTGTLPTPLPRKENQGI